MRVVSVSSTKGGSAKTSTVRTLGALLSEGQKVLMIDLDPQASLTAQCLSTLPRQDIGDVLLKQAKLSDVVHPLSKTLYIATASMQLTSVERSLQASPSGQFALQRALKGSGFDLVFIDPPPSLSQLSVNALVASNAIIIPIRPESNDVRALSAFLGLLDEIKEIPSVDLKAIAWLPVMVDPRITSHGEILSVLRALLATAKELPAIGRTTRMSEASAAMKSVTDYEPGNPRSAEYREAAKEIQKWLKQTLPAS